MSKEAIKLALEAVYKTIIQWDEGGGKRSRRELARRIMALAEQPAQQEPVAWMFEDDEDNGHKTFRQTPPSPEAVAYLEKWNRPAWVPIYTYPPAQRKPLTDEQIGDLKGGYQSGRIGSFVELIRAIEAAHGIKE
jgi:hypothetical protein